MNRKAVGIVGLGAKLPARVFENEEWTQYVDTSDEWIRTRTGIERRRIAGDDETTATLALGAAREALQSAELDASQLDEIIVATDTPEVYLPDTACFLQQGLGARTIPAFTLGGSGCAGFIQALDIATSRIRDRGGRVLVVGVELLSRIMDWRDRNTCVLFGDAAAAAILGTERPICELMAGTCGTDGEQIDILKLEVGGTRTPVTMDLVQARQHRNIVMKGTEVFRHAVSRMSQACSEVLEALDLQVDDVDLVIPHQANLRIIRSVARSVGVPMEKVYTNVEQYGNTGSASVPLALYEAHSGGRIAPGSVVLLTAFGAGFHWAAAVLRFSEV
ncbi:MAG: beta-ketoacyl-ACP synthase III [Acidobacteriota bacterium]|nr:beta-ketoacyl-ACP synthase III [Acidobacteriota bacterium]